MPTNTRPDYKYTFVPSPTRSHITLLLLHGTGGNEQSLLETGLQMAPHADRLSPLGNVLEGSHHRFFARVSEGVFDEEEINSRVDELHTFIAETKTTHHLEVSTLIAVGFSNGANIAAALLQRHPGVLSGAVLLRAMPVPVTPSTTPLPHTPVLLESGLHDALIPAKDAKALSAQLTQAGAEVTQIWHDADHSLTSTDVQEAKKWIANNF